MITVIKIGGHFLDEESALSDFAQAFSQVPGKKILVHGGGKLATQLSKQLGIATQMIDGRRVTDGETLKVITMTYAGWINKQLVAKLNACGCVSIGMCGADAAIITSSRRTPVPIDYGFAGDPIPGLVNVPFLLQLLNAGITPVIAPVTHDGKGQLLNTNADTMAGVLAGALSSEIKTQLIFCFEKKGVLTDLNDDSVILEKLAPDELAPLTASGTISKGMLPKLNAGFLAKRSGAARVVIGHAGSLHALVAGTTDCTQLLA